MVETYLDWKVLAKLDLAAAQWLADAGARSPETFRFMRKTLGLRAADLAELLDVAPETVSRWERGVLPVEHRAFGSRHAGPTASLALASQGAFQGATRGGLICRNHPARPIV